MANEGLPKLSVVVPAYNEADCVGQTIPSLLDALDRLRTPYEVLVVDNGSRDGTGRILTAIASTRPQLRVLRFEENRGYGGALLSGFAASRGEIVGFTCADGEVAPEEVVTMYRMMQAGGLDLCKGKRINRRDGFMREVMSFGYHFLVGLLFRMHTTDINGYPMLVRRAMLERFSLAQTNWMINVDVLWNARVANSKTAEVDVTHRPRAGGRSHVRWYSPVLFTWQLMTYARRARHRSASADLPAPAPVQVD